MKQFSATMSGNAEIIGNDWKGKAAAHKLYVDTGFKIGFTVEAKIAELIAKGFTYLPNARRNSARKHSTC